MKKLLSLATIILLTFTQLFAQNNWCSVQFATSVNSIAGYPCAPSSPDFFSKYLPQETWIPNYLTVGAMAPTKTINVNVIVYDNGSGTNFTQTDQQLIQNLFNELNNKFQDMAQPSDPRTGYCSPCYFQDSRFRINVVGYSFRTSTSINYTNCNYTGVGVDMNKTLNVFFMRGSSGIGGECRNAPHYGQGDDYILTGQNTATPYIIYKNLPKNYDLNVERGRLMHEVGHAFGLYHLYTETGATERCDDATYQDYLSDVFMLGSSKICPLYNLIPWGCNPFDTSVNVTATNNAMDGHLWWDKTYLSPLQLGRMHRNASFTGIRNCIVNTYPDNSNHDYIGEGNLNPLKITQNETWDFDIKMYSDIIVKPGVTLTVKCRILMPYMSNIIVEQGGHLVIDGGTITSHGDDIMWYGVEVKGDVTKNQAFNSQAPGGYWQGRITVKNSALLSNARHAILSHTGGIINVSNSTFQNNRRSIGFGEYRNFNNNNTTINNVSTIHHNTFELNRELPATPDAQITFWKVSGVYLAYNTFQNIRPATTSVIERGMGVTIADSKITLQHSTIKGFRRGANIGNAGGTKVPYIWNNEFINNTVGVYGDGSIGAAITDNTFEVADMRYTTGNAIAPANGIILRGSNTYDVSYNYFNQGHIGAKVCNLATGIKVVDGGSSDNLIEKNTFEIVKNGNVADGINTDGVWQTSNEFAAHGLSYKCNTYNIVTYGQYISGTSNTAHGINRRQGEITMPTGNTFLNATTAIKNEATAVSIRKYYYSTTASNQNPTISGAVTKSGKPITPCQTNTDPSDETGPVSFARQLNKYYTDSIDRGNQIDSLLLSARSPYTDLERVFRAIENRQYDAAINLYDAIRTTYVLNPEELADFLRGRQFIDLLISHKQTGISLLQLTETEINTLRAIIANTKVWAKSRACILLSLAIGEECPAPLPGIPEDYNEGTGRLATLVNNTFRIYPNPATQTITVEGPQDNDEIYEVIFTDIRGVKVAQLKIGKGQSKMDMDISGWAPGIYIYNCKSGGRTIDVGKLIKQ